MFCARCGGEVVKEAKFCPSCGHDVAKMTPSRPPPQAADAPEIDTVREALQTEYTIDSELGRGGMAIVYKAREKHLERDVAVKVLPASLGFDKQFVERFEREARMSARLEHPHIIPIYRVGQAGNVIYFVMKYLRGGSLSERLERRGKLFPEEIRRMLIETAGALGYAHRSGIVHRDIKPDNIMFDELGHAVLMDFGIAKAASGTRLTGTGMSIGTPHYMSPEQARAQSLDGRSDLYSLGVVAYQCLTGQVPFDGEDAFSIGYKHIMEPLPAPNLVTTEERELYDVITHMLAKASNERFQVADEVVAVLQGGTSTAVRGPDRSHPSDRSAVGDAALRRAVSASTPEASCDDADHADPDTAAEADCTAQEESGRSARRPVPVCLPWRRQCRGVLVLRHGCPVAAAVSRGRGSEAIPALRVGRGLRVVRHAVAPGDNRLDRRPGQCAGRFRIGRHAPRRGDSGRSGPTGSAARNRNAHRARRARPRSATHRQQADDRYGLRPWPRLLQRSGHPNRV
jgi:serine/threonine-protein kinase